MKRGEERAATTESVARGACWALEKVPPPPFTRRTAGGRGANKTGKDNPMAAREANVVAARAQALDVQPFAVVELWIRGEANWTVVVVVERHRPRRLGLSLWDTATSMAVVGRRSAITFHWHHCHRYHPTTWLLARTAGAGPAITPTGGSVIGAAERDMANGGFAMHANRMSALIASRATTPLLLRVTTKKTMNVIVYCTKKTNKRTNEIFTL